MYDRLLKLLEAEGKKPSWRQGDRVDPKHIRGWGDRVIHGMIGGVRGDDDLNTSINRGRGGPAPPKSKKGDRRFDKLT